MNDESLLSKFTIHFVKTGPTGATLKRMLRRAASRSTTQEVAAVLPAFREGGKLARNRRRR